MRPPAAAQTIAAVATPPGTGALGVLRLSGPGALSAALTFLRAPSGRALSAPEPRRATLAQAWAGGELLDETVATYFPGPGSATGEDLVEVSAHGSPLILRRLLEAALQGGARLADPGEFTQRAFLNGRLDLAQAEAVGALIQARSDAARRAALRQLSGGLSRRVAELKAPLLELLARLEAGLDHPEEDLPALSPAEAGAALERCREGLLELAATFDRGRLLSEGARVCLVGRPNAGKSSLLNALLGRERAIVCAEPGTTRDTLEEPAVLEGLPAVLVDTAGLGSGPVDAAETLGRERARGALAASDLAVLVLDGSRAETDEDRRLHDGLLERAVREGRALVTVLNKSDLPRVAGRDGLAVSAREGRGLPELSRLVAARLAGGGAGEEPATLVTAVRHRAALEAAAGEVSGSLEDLARRPGSWEELAASRLRRALAELGGVLGEGSPDEVLREIFSKFCVGK